MPQSVSLVWVTPDAEHLITDMARVSAPSNQGSYDTAPRLLKYLIKHRHWSPFEMASMCVEINTTRDIAAQIIRHRSFSFQEFCMAGSTQVYFDAPAGIKSNKKKLYKLTLEHLYSNWSKNERCKDRIRAMHVRVFDEKTKSLTNAHIKEVFKTGEKDIFEVTLENGRVIRSTKEHRILTPEGFLSLEEATGLELVGNTATISKRVAVGCNGTPVYKDYVWMKQAKQRNIANKSGLAGIAQDSGVSVHTVHKWLGILGLSFSKKEVAMYCEPWNKGKFGYSTGKRTEETKEKMRVSARRGEQNNLWRGGTTTERAAIQADIKKYREQLIKDYDGKCGLCHDKLDSTMHLHHITPVVEAPLQAREYSNLMPVHAECHRKHHGINGDCKTWKEKGRGNTLTVKWSKIAKVKYLGKQMTYDLEIDHESHNYVADGVIVHNSQRYANVRDIGELEIPEFRLQDKTNRQNSITGGLSSNIVEYLEHKTSKLFADAQSLYDEMISLGVAKECARKVLPMNSPSRIYMTGTLRSWMHYIDLRSSNGTQKEHMEIALAIKDIFAEEFPCIAAALKPTPPPQPVKEEPQDVTPEPVSLWEKVKKAAIDSLPYFS